MWLMLQVASLFLVALVMALSLAHALELPGKLRLDKETYLAVQPTSLRNSWEYSPVARAVLASFALIAFIVAVAI